MHPPNTSPQYLGDLLRAKRVYAVCDPCHRGELLNVRDLLQSYGRRMPLSSIERMLRCTRCGNRKARLRVIDR